MTNWANTPPGTPVLYVGTVTTGPAGSPVTVTVRDLNTLDFSIPQGSVGKSNIITIGTVTTLPTGSPATAQMLGDSPAQILNLGLPKGDTGANSTVPGPAGPPNTLAVGTVSNSAPGSSAQVTITGASPNQTINFVLPQGATGPVGGTGLTGYIYGNGGSAATASPNIPASVLSGTTLPSTITGSSLTSVGTIISGVWNGTRITPAYMSQATTKTLRGNPTGATADVSDNSLTSYSDAETGVTTQGSLLFRDSAKLNALPAGSAGQVVTSNGPGANPSYQNFVLRGYLSGLTLANNGTNPNTQLDVAPGVAASDDNTTMVSLNSTMTKGLGAWAAGSGNGGLDTGTIAASTWYHVFEIYNPTTSVADVLFSISLTSPTLPSGYTKKRRIGSIRINASTQITPFVQVGDDFQWNTVSNDASNVALTANTPVLQVCLVPTGLKVKARIRAYTPTTGGNTFIIISPDETGTINYGGNGNFNILTPGAGIADIITDTSARIKVIANAAANYYAATYGWTDTRGK